VTLLTSFVSLSADVDDTTDPNLTNIDDEEVATELLSENTGELMCLSVTKK